MKRLLLIVAAAALAAAALAPASAFAGKAHVLGYYKVEKHLDLEGEDATTKVSCKGSDYAVDGMWRIDNVDQDNDWQDWDSRVDAHYPNQNLGIAPDPGGNAVNPNLTILHSVRVLKAYSSGLGEYTFQFTPLAGGDVQIKLWVTCLPNPFGGFGHSHNWVLSTINSSAATTTTDPGTTPISATGSCGTDEIVAAPGYTTTSEDVDLIRSEPETSPSTDLKTWNWTFWQTTPAGGTTAYWRCLKLRSTASTAPVHTHRLVVNYKTTTFDGTPASTPKIKGKLASERQQSCSDHYKAMIGAFNLLDPNAPAPPPYGNYEAGKYMRVYYLGMDPRIKTRAFKFLNLDASLQTVTVGAVCFKDKTT